MPVEDTPHEASVAASNLVNTPNNPTGGVHDGDGALALTLTAVIVAFVGALVVLSIPFAVASIPLPSQVDRLGLGTGNAQSWFFERVWYLLVPAALIALWAGYRTYRWHRSTTAASARSGDTTARGDRTSLQNTAGGEVK